MNLRTAGLLLFAVALVAPAPAQDAAPRSRVPQSATALRDPDFGVESRGVTLEREVEMYQWREVDTDEGPRYRKAWSPLAVDSSRFAQPGGHENPPMSFPIEPARWSAARSFTLDGRPLVPAVAVQPGQWRTLRPDPARVPPNLAASFQPDGAGGLISSQDRRDPQVGDIRLRWRERRAAPITTPVALRNGRWVADAKAQASAAAPAATAGDAAPGDTASQQSTLRMLVYAGAVAAILGLLTLVALRRRRRH